jgi:hypothetical protein
MEEICGNMWLQKVDYYCIPINGTIRERDTTLVMGLGVAQQAKSRFPSIERDFGREVSKNGLRVFCLGVTDKSGRKVFLVGFPVKYNWWEPASLDLIRKSAVELKFFAEGNVGKKIVLPRPGCGAGRRDWDTEVKPILLQVGLPDNIVIVSY